MYLKDLLAAVVVALLFIAAAAYIVLALQAHFRCS